MIRINEQKEFVSRLQGLRTAYPDIPQITYVSEQHSKSWSVKSPQSGKKCRIEGIELLIIGDVAYNVHFNSVEACLNIVVTEWLYREKVLQKRPCRGFMGYVIERGKTEE